MTNQASEDELREQLADRLEWYSRYRERGQDDDMDRAFDGILTLIRTEKLKLLAEVRSEQVDAMKSNLHDMVVMERENYTPAAQSYALKRMQEINGELTKLEANQ